jgi:signal transduction histidine kinase
MSARRFAIPAAVLLSALILTAVATSTTAVSARDRDEARFANATQSTLDRLQQRLDLYTALLLSGVGLFAASDDVDGAQFRSYTDAIDVAGRYPGIQGIGFSQRIAPAGLPDAEARLRAEGVAGFRVWPEHERPEYHSIVYLQPEDARNLAAIGYDMFTEPTRRAAMERARDTGEPALSGRVTLVQEIDEQAVQAGFLMYTPVYAGAAVPATTAERRAALKGFVYAPFRADDLFAGIFGSEAEPRVAFHPYDGRVPEPSALLHTSAVHGTAPAADPQFTDTLTIEVAGRPWTLVFATTPFFEEASRGHLVPLVALLGTLLSLTLFGLAYIQVRSTHAAELSAARAEQLSAALVRQAGALEAQVREVNALNQELAAANERLTTANTEAEHARREAETARAAADDANRAKSQFLARMSHELRTPLNAIAGYVDLLDLGLRGPINDAQRSDLDRVRRAQRHLLGLIDDVLNFARLEAGRLHFRIEPLDVDDVLRDVESLIAPLAAARPVDYHQAYGEEPRFVLADREKLMQVLLNLLSNAVKFTDPGGSARVETAVDGDCLAVHVVDTGRGIPNDRLRSIFEPFVQVAEDLTRDTQGTGLGLTIAHDLTRAMGGTLTAESEVGAGSTFTLRLPLAPQPDGADRAAAAR